MADGITRREALGLVATAGVVVAAGKSMKKSEDTVTTQTDPILSVKPLGFPWETPDPFLFCVHHDDAYPLGNDVQGPAASLAGRNMGEDFAGKDGWRMYHGHKVPGFPQHPHRGFETVTVVRRGLIDHSDSMGATARYGHGDVQWLTAGKGILHAEMFPLVDRDNPNPLELFQIWLNLPRSNKLVHPYFTMFWDKTIPHQVTQDANGRPTEVAIVAGKLGDQQGPPPPPNSWASEANSDVAIWTVKMAPGAHWTLPAAQAGSNRTLYFFKGSGLSIGDRAIPAARAIQLRADKQVSLQAGTDEVECLLLQGRPINEPVVNYGPFVMNSREEIAQTIREYQQTQFSGWPWPSDEPVHAREDGRFARHADGKTERPA